MYLEGRGLPESRPKGCEHVPTLGEVQYSSSQAGWSLPYSLAIARPLKGKPALQSLLSHGLVWVRLRAMQKKAGFARSQDRNPS
jgi:hypothetical protein